MFDFAWSELAVIAAVALIVIGPKDLPRVLRMVGQWVRQARAIAREFQGSLDQMIRESELDEMKRTVDRATSFDFDKEFKQAVDPTGDLQRALDAPVMPNPLASPSIPVEAVTPPPLPIAAPSEPALPATEAALPPGEAVRPSLGEPAAAAPTPQAAETEKHG